MKLGLLAFLLSFQVYGTEIKILNFNIMCDFCKGSNFFEFDERIKSIQKLIARHQPDLMSLQEVRTVSQLKKILEPFPQYQFLATDSMLISYADPAIIYLKDKFELISEKTRWLGPDKDGFSFGWKMALPRQIKYADFKFQNKVFRFGSSHFDNIIENLQGSVKVLHEVLAQTKYPFIFAADTNIALDMEEYPMMVEGRFLNAFDIKQGFEVQGVFKNDRDLCYTKKGKKFPTCRVEHILLNDKYNWKVKKFILDTKQNQKGKFISDHRAVIVTIELPTDAPQLPMSN